MVSYVRGRTRTQSDAQIIEQYLAGDDAAAIGFRSNCSGDTVLYLVRRAGHQPRPRGPRARVKVLSLPDAEVIRLYREDGLSGPVIADRCGVSTRTIYDLLERHGVPRRPSGAVSAAMAAAARVAAKRRPPP